MEEKILTCMTSDDFVRAVCKKTGIRIEGMSFFQINAPLNGIVEVTVRYNCGIAEACIEEMKKIE